MELTDRTILVTGGAGFIGSHVVDRLVDRGCVVMVADDLSIGSLHNLEAHLRDDSIVMHQVDLRDRSSAQAVVEEADVVLHLAVASLRVSLRNPHLVHEVNTTATLNLLDAANRSGVERFVYVSSSEAYGSAEYAPMDEQHPLEPTTVYGATKAAGELYTLGNARTHGLPSMIVRPFNTYGPREHAEGTSAEVIPKFVHRALAGRPPIVFGDGKQTRDFTWVEDTARGIVEAAVCDGLVGGAVNIARGHEVTIRDVADLVLEAVGRDDLEPEMADERPGDVSRHYADTTKARQLLGFEATTDIREGIARYVDWVQQSGTDIDAWASRDQVQNW